MKINLSPETAYFAGLWKARKIPHGIGISGNSEAQQIFVSEAMKTFKIPPEKILVKDELVYFYHSAIRKFLEGVVEGELEFFQWKNEFAFNFLAGMFDGSGGVDEEKGAVYLTRTTRADQQLLERLGFMTAKRGGKLYLAARSVPEFAISISRYMKMDALKSRLLALLRPGNERDPR